MVGGLVRCLLAVPLLRFILNNLKRRRKVLKRKIQRLGKGRMKITVSEVSCIFIFRSTLCRKTPIIWLVSLHLYTHLHHHPLLLIEHTYSEYALTCETNGMNRGWYICGSDRP